MPPQPNNLHSYEWKPDPNFRIRIHTPPPAECSFDDSPQASPGGERPPHTHLPVSPTADPDTLDSTTIGKEDTARSDSPPPPREHLRHLTPTPGGGVHLHTPTLPPPETEITIITLNTQKVGNNSPYVSDTVTLLDLHTPDVLLLTKTPLHPHQGAPSQVLRDRGYKTHYHPMNTPSPKGTLPEARLPTHTTYNGCGF